MRSCSRIFECRCEINQEYSCKCKLYLFPTLVVYFDSKAIGQMLPWKSMMDEQRADVEHVQRLYQKENDMITFESIPQEAMLDIPEPKSLMTPIPYP
jgi:hypothetical protein